MFVKSMTWYIDPAAPCVTPTVAFRYRVAQAGVPAAAPPGLPGEDEPGEASADDDDGAAADDDVGAAADDDDATPGAGVRLAVGDDEDAHPVAKAATAIKPAAAVSTVRCSVIVASPLCGVLAGPRVLNGPATSKTPSVLLRLAGDYGSFAEGRRQP